MKQTTRNTQRASAMGTSETLRRQYDLAMQAYNNATAAGKSEVEAESAFYAVMWCKPSE